MASVCKLPAFALILACCLVVQSCSNEPALPCLGVVPEFILTDQTGAIFHSPEKLDGHIWIADFIFTNCMGPCPRMSTQMNQIRKQINDNPDVKSVSFTIDPDRDTPAVLAAYGKRYKADPDRWYLLTGTRPELKKLSWDAFHLGDVNGELEHSTRFVLVDQKSRIRGYYDSSDPQSIQQLVHDVQRLMRDS